MMHNGVDQRDVKAVYDAHEQGASLRAAARAGNTRPNSAKLWLAHPEKFDPYLDETAIVRALEGEKEVFRNLTVWERMETFLRLRAKIDGVPNPDSVTRMYAEAWGASYEAVRQGIFRAGARERSPDRANPRSLRRSVQSESLV